VIWRDQVKNMSSGTESANFVVIVLRRTR